MLNLRRRFFEFYSFFVIEPQYFICKHECPHFLTKDSKRSIEQKIVDKNSSFRQRPYGLLSDSTGCIEHFSFGTLVYISLGFS